MNNNDIPTLDTVKFGKLKRIIKNLAKNSFEDDDDVSFEYIVGSCFPTVYSNVMDEIKNQYTLGYIAGCSERETAYDVPEESTN